MLIPTLSAAPWKNKKIPPFSEGYITIFLKSSAIPLNSALLSDFLHSAADKFFPKYKIY